MIVKILKDLLKKQYPLDDEKLGERMVVDASDIEDKIKELEQEEQMLDKIRVEIMDTLYVDSLIFGELIDFKNGKISADDVIEEFNRVTRMEVLRIIDKYKEESEK